jgi:hypothetical protein
LVRLAKLEQESQCPWVLGSLEKAHGWALCFSSPVCGPEMPCRTGSPCSVRVAVSENQRYSGGDERAQAQAQTHTSLLVSSYPWALLALLALRPGHRILQVNYSNTITRYDKYLVQRAGLEECTQLYQYFVIGDKILPGPRPLSSTAQCTAYTAYCLRIGIGSWLHVQFHEVHFNVQSNKVP